MGVEDLIHFISQYGYPALFLALWLGIIGAPIPDELIVMTGGLVTSLDILKPIPAFLLTYLGVVSGLTIGYVIGRVMGASAITWLKRKKNIEKHIIRSSSLIDKYGPLSICVSYFFPIVRHIVPYLVGIGRMSFSKYILYSYSTGFVWTLIYFMVGHTFGTWIDEIAFTVRTYGLYMLGAGVLGILIYVVLKRSKRSNTVPF